MASPAGPILASALWTPNTTSNDTAQSHTQQSPKLSTGCQTTDKALEGGLDYGSICAISGESETGAREIAQSLLVSQLLSSPTATATFIDTGSSLDVRKLHKALTTRLQSHADAAKEAAKMLDRVNMMKTFDFVGLTEAIAELKDGFMAGYQIPSEKLVPPARAPKATIGDSDDEASEEDLLDTPTSAPPVQTSLPTPSAQTNHLLIISTLTTPFAPLQKTNYTRAQALLSSFMRSLSHLTKQHSICTVLLNDATAYTNAKEESPSIFSSCKLQPALGKAFGYALDVHLLVHQMPRETNRREEVSVLEVMQDRYSERIGRWAAFAIDEATGGRLVGIS